MIEKIHDRIKRKLWKTHIKLKRNKLNREQQLIHKELQNYKAKMGAAPDKTDPIWVRLSNLQESYVELRWLKE